MEAVLEVLQTESADVLMLDKHSYAYTTKYTDYRHKWQEHLHFHLLTNKSSSSFQDYVLLRINTFFGGFFFLLHKNVYAHFSSLFIQLTHTVWPTGWYKLPVIKRSKMDGIISQHCPHPPLPVIVCHSFKTL